MGGAIRLPVFFVWSAPSGRKGERWSSFMVRRRQSKRSGEGEPFSALLCGSSVLGECGREGKGGFHPPLLAVSGRKRGRSGPSKEEVEGFSFLPNQFRRPLGDEISIRRLLNSRTCYLERLDIKQSLPEAFQTLKTAVWSVLGQQIHSNKFLLRNSVDSSGDIWKGLDSSLPPWEHLG
ncbi:hypothetical protein MA16_Dca026119 [Dendrobium catenatum]|uniref:Uncharacterized protein n=1 Tax=Dendrobium catenatum TaxID=906689 RepID=A0A2I0WDQ2_9ASPA|nr:hypothetical protein MA16_Dca026119 [Dendrobium catenatum]